MDSEESPFLCFVWYSRSTRIVIIMYRKDPIFPTNQSMAKSYLSFSGWADAVSWPRFLDDGQCRMSRFLHISAIRFPQICLTELTLNYVYYTYYILPLKLYSCKWGKIEKKSWKEEEKMNLGGDNVPYGVTSVSSRPGHSN